MNQYTREEYQARLAKLSKLADMTVDEVHIMIVNAMRFYDGDMAQVKEFNDAYLEACQWIPDADWKDDGQSG